LESLSSLLSNPTNGAPFGLSNKKDMVDLLKAAQKLRRRARTSRDSMNAELVGLPPP